ncbi:unnamed protein product, partial [Laminaria digitata]
GGDSHHHNQHHHYHHHPERDNQQSEAWSPSGDAGGPEAHPSPHWPRYGDEADGDDAALPYRSNEPQRHHQQGPSSAPEISYMGHAASRARERAAAAAAAAAAGLRGVAFSLAGESPRRQSDEVGAPQPQAAPSGGVSGRDSSRGGQRVAVVARREDVAGG